MKTLGLRTWRPSRVSFWTGCRAYTYAVSAGCCAAQRLPGVLAGRSGLGWPPKVTAGQGRSFHARCRVDPHLCAGSVAGEGSGYCAARRISSPVGTWFRTGGGCPRIDAPRRGPRSPLAPPTAGTQAQPRGQARSAREACPCPAKPSESSPLGQQTDGPSCAVRALGPPERECPARRKRCTKPGVGTARPGSPCLGALPAVANVRLARDRVRDGAGAVDRRGRPAAALTDRERVAVQHGERHVRGPDHPSYPGGQPCV